MSTEKGIQRIDRIFAKLVSEFNQFEFLVLKESGFTFKKTRSEPAYIVWSHLQAIFWSVCRQA